MMFASTVPYRVPEYQVIGVPGTRYLVLLRRTWYQVFQEYAVPVPGTHYLVRVQRDLVVLRNPSNW